MMTILAMGTPWGWKPCVSCRDCVASHGQAHLNKILWH